MIQCNNISLSFPDKVIFDNLDLLVEKGENVCLSGPSGIGKSTLLKLFLGFMTPDHGEIRINNQKLNEASIKQIRENITWIPQNINLPVENGSDLMKLMNVSSRQGSVEDLLQRLGLKKDIIAEPFGNISIGEKQRIIISICLSLDKEIILMDEPTASLDDDSIDLLINTIKSLEGKTIVSASHNRLWVESCDKKISL